MRVLKRIMIMMILLLMSGCAMQSEQNNYQSAIYETRQSYDSTQMINYDAFVTIETKNYDEDVEAILAELDRQEGTIKTQTHYRYHNDITDYDGPALDVTVSIPSNHLQEYLTYLQKQYQVQDFTITSEDISERIDDLSEALKILQDRLTEVDQKLAETGLTFAEREALETQKRELEDQIKQNEAEKADQTESVAYATLSMTIQNVDYYKNEQLPFWLPFMKVFSLFFTYLGYSLILALVLIPVLFIGGVGYLIIRKKEYQMLQRLKNKEDSL